MHLSDLRKIGALSLRRGRAQPIRFVFKANSPVSVGFCEYAGTRIAAVLTNLLFRQYDRGVSTATHRKRPVRREERVSRTYRLPLSKLQAAKRALGAATATETIERALDLVVFQRELIDGTRAMLGIEITSPDTEP